jgi:pSer/pThr/pTyr-binding forkhead associated (FHA) protein
MSSRSHKDWYFASGQVSSHHIGLRLRRDFITLVDFQSKQHSTHIRMIVRNIKSILQQHGLPEIGKLDMLACAAAS